MITPMRMLALAALASLAGRAPVQEVDPAKIQRIRSLPPERLAELKMRLEQFKKLPSEEQERLRENLQRLKNMAPEQVSRLRERAARLSESEKKEYAELAADFFRWAHRNRRLEGFPRGLFFTWLKRERPERIAEIRAMPPGASGPRVEALAGLAGEFRDVAFGRVREHARLHKCVAPAEVAALGELGPGGFWPKFQELQRACPLYAQRQAKPPQHRRQADKPAERRPQ